MSRPGHCVGGYRDSAEICSIIDSWPLALRLLVYEYGFVIVEAMVGGGYDATTMLPCFACDAATPSTRLAVERIPSFAPNTAARSQPLRCVRWTSLLRTAMVVFLRFRRIGVYSSYLHARRSL